MIEGHYEIAEIQLTRKFLIRRIGELKKTIKVLYTLKNNNFDLGLIRLVENSENLNRVLLKEIYNYEID